MIRPALYTAARAGLWLLCGVTLGGCGRIARAKECGALARQVNAELAAIAAITSTTPALGPDELDGASKRYAALGAAIGAGRGEARPVDRAVQEYARHLERAAKATSAYATALREKDEAKRLAARRDWEKVNANERRAVQTLDDACHAH
jgi:hypothetical protein